MVKPRRKYRWFRRILRVLVVLIGLFIIACYVVDHYYQFRKSDDELKKIFAERKINGTIQYYETYGRRLRYSSAGDTSLPVLLMLHGSPGSISYYSGRFADSAIRGRFRVYAVDRPGYGYSGFGNPEPSIEMQAKMIRPILDSLNRVHHPVIVMGGSYGASVACRMAMDYPELVDGLILTGPALGARYGKNVLVFTNYRELVHSVVYSAYFPFCQYRKDASQGRAGKNAALLEEYPGASCFPSGRKR
jgi:pimeloyl-ACP methyl ester carboxylesterase